LSGIVNTKNIDDVNHELFALAFGLTSRDTCDLLYLLEILHSKMNSKEKVDAQGDKKQKEEEYQNAPID
jgi:hypothetical protein